MTPSKTSGPLSGINVLEFTQVIAGPFCCMLLADMGANVIKVEPLEGEPWRIYAELIPKESRTFSSLNRGKQGLAIDLQRPEARSIIRDLVSEADVVVINYRPGVAEDLGIAYDDLKKINERLIYCENTAFGREGPLAHRGGYDIVVQALTGLMAGEAKMLDDVPTSITPAIADYATGITMANSICAALYFREKTGKGQRIDCTLLGTALAMQPSHFTWIDAFDSDVIPPMLEALTKSRLRVESFAEQAAIRHKYRPPAVGNIYYRVYQTSDGFIAVGALSNSLRRKVLAATGLDDPRFLPDGSFELAPEGWDKRGPLILDEAKRLFLTRTTEQWGLLLENHGVPSGPLSFIEELFDHPQITANNLVWEVEHELLGSMRMVAPPFQMSESPLSPQGPSPVLGADNERVLVQQGRTPAEIQDLRDSGVIL